MVLFPAKISLQSAQMLDDATQLSSLIHDEIGAALKQKVNTTVEVLGKNPVDD